MTKPNNIRLVNKQQINEYLISKIMLKDLSCAATWILEIPRNLIFLLKHYFAFESYY